MNATTALWATVLALGLYHGLNPAMGWPIAVANGLTERRGAAVFRTVLPLGAGHFAAMTIVLLPVAGLAWVAAWSVPIRIGAGALVLAFGLYKLVDRRHPRALARIPPSRLAWWSFLMATAHGAGLMLVPVTLGLCTTGAAEGRVAAAHSAMMDAMARSDVVTAVVVALLHTLVTMAAGLVMAWAVYRYLGLQFLRRSWFNLDLLWAASLVAAGAAGVWSAL